MDELEQQQRNTVVALARTWVGTPYRTGACVRGPDGGVDCANLPAAVYQEAGMVEKFEVEYYPPDWHLHQGAERYLNRVMMYGRELPEGELPKPGDMVVWRFGRCFAHGAIVVEWPRVIHAFVRTPCGYANAEQDHLLKYVGENGPDKGKERVRKFITLWGR